MYDHLTFIFSIYWIINPTYSQTNISYTCYTCNTSNNIPCNNGYLLRSVVSTNVACDTGILWKYTCSSCGVGYFANGSNTYSCSVCNIGTYTNTTGATGCYGCNVGSYTTDIGSSFCYSCSVGTYSSSIQMTNCTLCEIGTYASSNGSSTCTHCDIYSFSTTVGALQCTACPVGTLSSDGITCHIPYVYSDPFTVQDISKNTNVGIIISIIWKVMCGMLLLFLITTFLYYQRAQGDSKHHKGHFKYHVINVHL